MKRVYLFIFLGLIVLVVVYIFVDLAYRLDDKSISDSLINLRKVGDSNIGLEQEEKKLKDLQSYYRLDRFKIFTQSSRHSSAYISVDIALGYPYDSYDTEKEIIDRKGQIRAFIQRYISGKNYRELDTSGERARLKVELLYGINKMMKRSISDIYYIEFVVLPHDNY